VSNVSDDKNENAASKNSDDSASGGASRKAGNDNESGGKMDAKKDELSGDKVAKKKSPVAKESVNEPHLADTAGTKSSTKSGAQNDSSQASSAPSKGGVLKDAADEEPNVGASSKSASASTAQSKSGALKDAADEESKVGASSKSTSASKAESKSGALKDSADEESKVGASSKSMSASKAESKSGALKDVVPEARDVSGSNASPQAASEQSEGVASKDFVNEKPSGSDYSKPAQAASVQSKSNESTSRSSEPSKSGPDQADVVKATASGSISDIEASSVTATISPANKAADTVSSSTVQGAKMIAENIFPESLPLKNISKLLEPTISPSNSDPNLTYDAIAAAAEEADYESRQDVISSVQSILRPKGEFLSRAELLQASKQLRKVMPYNFEAWRLHADILLNALRQLETRQLMPDESFQILATPLREDDIRDAAEAALRECAHFAPNEARRIALIDEANSVRRLTWF